jgi:hypothetical protein
MCDLLVPGTRTQLNLSHYLLLVNCRLLVTREIYNGQPLKYLKFGFASPNCKGTVDRSNSDCLGGPSCSECLENKLAFVRKCRSANAISEKAAEVDFIDPKLLCSPTDRLTNIHARQARHRNSTKDKSRLNTMLKTLKDLIKDMMVSDKGKESPGLSPKLAESLGVDSIYDIVLDVGVQKAAVELMRQEFSESNEVTHKELAEYVWKEFTLLAEIAKKHGKKACRPSPIVYKLAMELYAKLGTGRYTMLSNIIPLPSDRSVQARLSKGCNETDGVLNNNIKDMEELFTNAYGDSVPDTDFRRMVSLALDSTTINDGLVSNMHTGHIVGIGADDPSAGMDGFASAIRGMVRTLESNNIVGNDDDTGDDCEPVALKALEALMPSSPLLAKHYMTYIVQSLSETGRLFKTTVARYGFNGLNAPKVENTIRETIDTLACHGFLCAAIGLDGATENRKTIHAMCDRTVGDLIDSNIFPDEWRDNSNIPKELQIAMVHPWHPDVLIFIHGDMPHAIKKFVNALESSSSKSKRDLKFRGQPLSLEMSHAMYLRQQANVGETALSSTRLCADAFSKNCENRMTAWLAFKITSKSMIATIENNCNTEEEKATYGPLVEILGYLDKFIDIINAKKSKGFSSIDRSDHPYLDDLLKVVTVLTEWKHEAGTNKLHFLPMSTYEDLMLANLSTIGLAKLYLPTTEQLTVDSTSVDCSDCSSLIERPYKYLKLATGRLGSDVCEHRFGDAKSRGAHDKLSFDQSTGRADAVSGCRAFNMKDSGNAGGAKIDPKELTADLPTTNGIKKKERDQARKRKRKGE